MGFNRVSLGFRKFCAVSALLFAAGCGGGCGQSCQTDLLLGHDRNSGHTLALSQTAEAFVRGDTWGKDRGRVAVAPTANAAPVVGARQAAAGAKATGGSVSLVSLDADALGPDSDTLWRVDHSRSVGLRHQRSFAIAGGFRGYGSLTASLGQTRYDLPRGMGPAKEPITIDMQSAQLQPEIGVQRDWTLRRARLQSAVGLGTQISQTTTSVQSPVFNVVYRSTQNQPYAALRLGVQPDFTPLAADIEARVARDGLSQIRADLRLPF